MLSEKIGLLLKKSTKNKFWWIKLGFSLILSNIFFFVLFSNSEDSIKKLETTPTDHVEIQLSAALLTPFQIGKKILIVNRKKRIKIQGVLISQLLDEENRLTFLVNEKEANHLFLNSNWEILPYMKYLSFASIQKDQDHEIRY